MIENGSLQHRASEAVRNALALRNRHDDLTRRAREAVRHAVSVHAEIKAMHADWSWWCELENAARH